MTTTPNLGLTQLESGLRQPEVVINNNNSLIDAAFIGASGLTLLSRYASLSAAVTAIGSDRVTLAVDMLSAVVSNLTVPSNITLFFVDDGGLQPANSVTLTIQGPVVAPPMKIFYNALASQGSVRFTGNNQCNDFLPEWWGAIGNDSFDCTPAIQAILDMLDAGDRSGTIKFQSATYRISGALQDTSFSNSQIVLPRRNPASQNQIAIRLVGQSAPIPFPHASGTILKSTLASGTGSMISVKCNWGSGTSSQSEIVANHRSAVSFAHENMTFRMVANPTNSCLNLRFIPHYSYSGDNLIDVAGIGLSGGSITLTEPTTSTSYGLLTPVDFCSAGNIGAGHLLIMGYYNCMALGELFHGADVELAATKVALELRGGSHANHFDKLLIVAAATLVKTTGRDTVFSPIGGAINTCLIKIDQLDFENGGSPAWTATSAGNHLSDSGNYLTGEINWSSTLYEFTKTGAVNCKTHPIAKPWHSVRPFTNATGIDLDAANHAVHEIYRGIESSVSTHNAWLLLTSKQSGTALKGVGNVAFVNDKIADGSDKRIAMLSAFTDGAINSGQVQLYTWNAGTLVLAAFFDKFANLGIGKFLIDSQGGTLTIASNTITPTNALHTVDGAGPLQTITAPSELASYGSVPTLMLSIVPAATWAYNSSGNILGSGTAVVNRLMIARWMPNISKWAMSY